DAHRKYPLISSCTVMRSIIFIIVLTCLVAASANSQTISCGTHPTDSTATLLGSFTVSVPLSASSGLGPLSSGGCTVHEDVCVWLTGSGHVEYVIKTGSIRLEGDCPEVDTITTSRLFDLLAWGAVAEGIALGYTPCTDT